MDMKQLEAFVAVVKCSSFSKAADMIYLSQSTISAHISSLEKEMNTQLLVRTARQVYPTPIGRDIFQRAQTILAMRDETLGSTQRLSEISRGEISILASTVPAQFLLPKIVSNFRRLYPNIVFRIQQADSRGAVSGVLDCRFDFGFIGTPPGSDRLEGLPIYEDNLVLIAPKEMKLSKHSITTNLMNVIGEIPFIMREEGSGTRSTMEQLLRQHGGAVRDLNIAAYFYDTQSVISAVSQGIGVSFVSELAAETALKQGDVQALHIWKGTFTRQLYLVYQKEVAFSPIQNAFIDFMEGTYQGEIIRAS